MNSLKNSSCLITTLNTTILRRCDTISCLRSSQLNGRIPILQNAHPIHTTPNLQLFWERHRKGGYNKNVKRVSQKELILEGFKQLKKEIVLWKQEVQEKLECDPVVIFRPGTLTGRCNWFNQIKIHYHWIIAGETDVKWQFRDESDFEDWKVTNDSDHNEGQSFSTFEISAAGHGLFSGNVQSKVPLDGRIKRAGYSNIQSMRARVSFSFNLSMMSESLKKIAFTIEILQTRCVFGLDSI